MGDIHAGSGDDASGERLATDVRADDSTAAARRVVRLIVEAIGCLKLFPHSGRKGQVQGTYELAVPKLSFIVVYVVSRDAIDIIAIVHATRGESNRFIK